LGSEKFGGCAITMSALDKSVMPKCATARAASAPRSVYVLVGPGGLADEVFARAAASSPSSTQIPPSWSVGLLMNCWLPAESVW
jgi:hypothetical protein